MNFQLSNYSDTVYGSSASETFYLGNGSDVVYGGGGFDIVTFYSTSSTGYQVNYNPNSDLWTITNGQDVKKLYQVYEIQFGDKVFVSPKTVTLSNGLALSFAGVWTPIQATTTLLNGQLANTYHSLIKLDNSGYYGLVNTGWGYYGFDTTLKVPSNVNMSILMPDQPGKLNLNTSKYISDSVTSGGGSVVVADFNGDGVPDIFLAAHNESPLVPCPSTAYISNALGQYTKLTLTDSVTAHDAQLFYINEMPYVAVSAYTGDKDPVYQFVNGQFTETQMDTKWIFNSTTNNSLGGCAATIDSFGVNKSLELVRADVSLTDKNFNIITSDIEVFSYSSVNTVGTIPLQVIQPYLSTLPEFQNIVSMNGIGQSHVYRVWSEDLNHDGSIDVIAGESMWSAGSEAWPSALQMLINNGNGSFKDETSKLNPDISLAINEFDYSPTFIDLDRSGIDTLLFSGVIATTASRQSNFVLLNDGTGRLYVGLHDQFISMTPLVYEFLDKQFASDVTYSVPLYTSSTPIPKFIGIPQPDGSVNFVAEVELNQQLSNGLQQAQYVYVNVPLSYKPTTDFTQNITITDRNNSMLMRTWAGNDTFYDTNANAAPAHIDGGLGLNTSVYSGQLKDYHITQSLSNVVGVNSVGTSNNPKINDTLVNIERLQFADKTINLTIPAQAAAAPHADVVRLSELYVAFFNRIPDADGLSYWISQKVAGQTINQIADTFYGAGVQYSSLTGFTATMSNTAFINVIYKNVLGRADGADAGGLAYWNAKLVDGSATRGSLVSTILDAAHTYKGDATYGYVANWVFWETVTGDSGGS